MPPIVWPISLTCLRLLLGPVAILMAVLGAARLWFAPLLLAGMLSDLFDGVLARKFGVSTPWLRRFDSLTDDLFYICILIATWLAAGDVIRSCLPSVAALLASEALCIGTSLIRFRALPATHCYSAKAYGLALFLAFLAVLSLGAGTWVVWVLTGFGLVANAEVMAVLLLSTKPPVDVPSVFTLLRHPS